MEGIGNKTMNEYIGHPCPHIAHSRIGALMCQYHEGGELGETLGDKTGASAMVSSGWSTSAALKK